MKYILTGGGTGGHIYPALAIADFIKKDDKNAKFIYLGTKNRLEATLVPNKGYKIKFINATGLPNKKISLDFIIFFIALCFGIFKSAFHILIFKPQIIIATGGFVSAPVVIAGYFLRKIKLYKGKIFIHEANAEAGKMVKLCGRMADGVGVAYINALKTFKNGRYVGLPVREEFYKGSRKLSREKLNIAQDELLILSVGGSQGARNINTALIEALPYITLEKNIKLYHVIGKGTKDYNPQEEISNLCLEKSLNLSSYKFYKQFDYLNNIIDYLFAADLIITRGGASTLAELPITSTPAIVIPKANLSGDHQVVNAEELKNLGSAEVIYETTLIRKNSGKVYVKSQELVTILNYLILNPHKLELMRNSYQTINNIATGGKEITRFIKNILGSTKENLNIENKKINSKAKQELKSYVNNNPFACLGDMGIVSLLIKYRQQNQNKIIEDNLQYLKYRAGHYFISSNWSIKNYGIKISGLIQDKNSIDTLSSFFNDKRKASFIHRCFKGDYIIPGFLRRNIMIAYNQIKEYNTKVVNDIILGLEDPYYEVVAEALKNISEEPELFNNSEGLNKIENLLKKKKEFDIINEALKAFFNIISLGNLDNKKILIKINNLNKFFTHSNYLHREQIIKGLKLLLEKKLLTLEEVFSIQEKIIITQVGFTPEFSMKIVINDLIKVKE